MGKSCPAGQYWDALVKNCLDCRMVCQRPHVITRCISHCASADCKALPGHYYDALLKICVSCSEVCGRHPAQCSEYCPTQPTPVTTKKLLVKVTPQIPDSSGLSALMAFNSTILLYSLLALCIALLLSSLSLALRVFLRKSSKSSKPASKGADNNQEVVVQLDQGVGQPKGLVNGSSHPTELESFDYSSPTETCACVHCFPDLKALGQGHDSSLRAPFTINQQAILQRAQIQNGGGPLWTHEGSYTSGMRGKGEAAVG